MILNYFFKKISYFFPLDFFIWMAPKNVMFYGHIICDSQKHLLKKIYNYPNFYEFNEILNSFERFGFKKVSLKDFQNLENDKKIHLSLDDGFKQILSDFDEYKNLECPFSIHIISEAVLNSDFKIISKLSNQYIQDKDLFLSVEDILFLKENKIEIGFHTNNHEYLGDVILIDEKFKSNVFPKKEISHLLNKPLIFSYPYRSPINVDEINDYLFKNGYSIILGTSSTNKSSKSYYNRFSIDYLEGDFFSLKHLIKHQILMYKIKNIL